MKSILGRKYTLGHAQFIKHYMTSILKNTINENLPRTHKMQGISNTTRKIKADARFTRSYSFNRSAILLDV